MGELKPLMESSLGKYAPRDYIYVWQTSRTYSLNYESTIESGGPPTYACMQKCVYIISSCIARALVWGINWELHGAN